MPKSCQRCKKYKSFIKAMIDEFDKYKANKTAKYYKGQCQKVLAALTNHNFTTGEN